MHVERLSGAEPDWVPNASEQLLPRNDSAWVLRKDAQQVELLRSQLHPVAIDDDLTPGAVNGHIACLRWWISTSTSPNSANPCSKLPHGVRLDDVVVGTELKSNDPIRLIPACRSDDHRHVTCPSDLAQDVESVRIGQTEVEQDDVWIMGLRAGNRVGTSDRDLDIEPVTHQRFMQRRRQHRVVLDHQHAHHEIVAHARHCLETLHLRLTFTWCSACARLPNVLAMTRSGTVFTTIAATTGFLALVTVGGVAVVNAATTPQQPPQQIAVVPQDSSAGSASATDGAAPAMPGSSKRPSGGSALTRPSDDDWDDDDRYDHDDDDDAPGMPTKPGKTTPGSTKPGSTKPGVRGNAPSGGNGASALTRPSTSDHDDDDDDRYDHDDDHDHDHDRDHDGHDDRDDDDD